ncbi:MAG: tryptophan synthase subunit beta like protein [Gammaproteobacteria bacterium]|nr:tryptophan synthase subunit beta like protein [Gammaproteobacteria bacterium]
MVHVKRDKQGRVHTVSLMEGQDTEPMDMHAPEVQAFRAVLAEGAPQFTESDLQLVRVLEDVIALLVDRGVIRFTDLPEPARAKLMARESLRKERRGLDLLVDDEEIL